MSNPFLNRLNNPKVGNSGRMSEKRVLKQMGAKSMPASGAMPGAKSDGVLGDFRLELKSTINQTISVDVGWLSKISSEALSHNQKPALVLSFVTSEGKPQMKHNSEWVCIPKSVFEGFLV